jgi:hypothetical protein
MATMLASRNLRKEPNGDPVGVIASAGASVDILGNQDVAGAGSWTKVRLAVTFGLPEGWVSSEAVDVAGAAPVGPIDKMLFAKECWRQALYTGTNAHYLVAAAELRSHIKTGKIDEKRIGPFCLSQKEWDATLRDKEFKLDFLPAHIDNWRMQVAVFAVMTLRVVDKLIAASAEKKRPSAIELYVAQSESPPADAAARVSLLEQLKQALDGTHGLVLAAGADILADAEAAVTPTNAAAARINVGAVPAGREEIAKLILSKFRDAGYGEIQQIAALANAIAESNLNPKAINNTPPEHSVGLFQLNMKGGLGTNHDETQLTDPATNIDIIIKEAKRFDAFKNASSLFDAVDVFVRKVERPANASTQVQIRAKIAERLKHTEMLLA